METKNESIAEPKNEGSTETRNKSALESKAIEDTRNHKARISAKNIPPPRFTKEQLVQSAKYSNNRDLLNALLEDGHSYTSEEAEGIIQAFHQKGGV